MSVSLGLIWLGVAALSGLVFKSAGMNGVRTAGRDAVGMFTSLVVRLLCALLAATFLMQILPAQLVSKAIGSGSGISGILIAAALGAFIPGGPMVTFPIAVVLQQAGAGMPQLVALIVGWSVLDVNRLLTYEAPIMRWRFTALRVSTCLLLPVLSGLGAQLFLYLTGAP